MKIYNASIPLGLLKTYYETFHKPINVLLSIATVGKELYKFRENRHMIRSCICDSGAWSTHNADLKIDVVYVKTFYCNNKDLFDWYINFDEDFSTRGFAENLENQKTLEEAGLRPVPVVHNFYNDEIEYYVEEGYNIIALGSSQNTSLDATKYAVEKIKRLNPEIKIHLLGFTKIKELIELPIASSDSASWAISGKFGFIKYWNWRKKGYDKTDHIYVDGYHGNKGNSYDFATYPFKKELEDYLESNFGFSYKDLLGYRGQFNVLLINLHYYVTLEDIINEERRRLNIPLE
ncbi:MAG TPA: hypothetical protein ENI51_02245 [Candidatus Atribacteria bacterium]|nr:hypothetical protein [Candidatus Atribacteria bacterium]